MKSLLAMLILPALTGCVVFPHGEWVAPPALGQVLDAGDLQPIAQAKVTRRVEAFDRERVVSADAHGNFDLKKDTDLRCLPFVCYAASPIDYRIEAVGYRPFTTNLYGGGSFSHRAYRLLPCETRRFGLHARFCPIPITPRRKT